MPLKVYSRYYGMPLRITRLYLEIELLQLAYSATLW